MSLPEKNYAHSLRKIPNGKCPKLSIWECNKCSKTNHGCIGGDCPPDCPACLEAARDKEWAKWILEHFNFIVISDEKEPDDFVLVDDYPITVADFEALKKLAESEK